MGAGYWAKRTKTECTLVRLLQARPTRIPRHRKSALLLARGPLLPRQSRIPDSMRDRLQNPGGDRKHRKAESGGGGGQIRSFVFSLSPRPRTSASSLRGLARAGPDRSSASASSRSPTSTETHFAPLQSALERGAKIGVPNGKKKPAVQKLESKAGLSLELGARRRGRLRHARLDVPPLPLPWSDPLLVRSFELLALG